MQSPVLICSLPEIWWLPANCSAGSYEATLWAGVINARERGSNKVFLTFIGGGVFGNRSRWILSAIARAIDKVQDAGTYPWYASLPGTRIKLVGHIIHIK